MKRKVYAWILAAAMVFTSVPGYAVSAIAGEVDDDQVVADDSMSTDDSAGGLSEASTANGGQGSLFETENVQPGDTALDVIDLTSETHVTEESETETETSLDTEESASGPEETGRAAETEIQPATETVDTEEVNGIETGDQYSDDEVIQAESDTGTISEDDTAVEEEANAAESESSGTDNTGNFEIDLQGISSVTLKYDESTMFSSDTYWNNIAGLLSVSILKADGSTESLDYWQWSQQDVTIDGQTCSTYTYQVNNEKLGLVFRDDQGTVLASSNEIPLNTNVTVAPFIIKEDGSIDTETLEGSGITFRTPAYPDATALSLGSSAVVGSTNAFFDYAVPEGERDQQYVFDFAAEDRFSANIHLYKCREADGKTYVGSSSNWSPSNQDSWCIDASAGSTADKFLLSISGVSGQNMTVTVSKKAAVSSIEASPMTYSHLEAANSSYDLGVNFYNINGSIIFRVG